MTPSFISVGYIFAWQSIHPARFIHKIFCSKAAEDQVRALCRSAQCYGLSNSFFPYSNHKLKGCLEKIYLERIHKYDLHIFMIDKAYMDISLLGR